MSNIYLPLVPNINKVIEAVAKTCQLIQNDCDNGLISRVNFIIVLRALMGMALSVECLQ